MSIEKCLEIIEKIENKDAVGTQELVNEELMGEISTILEEKRSAISKSLFMENPENDKDYDGKPDDEEELEEEDDTEDKKDDEDDEELEEKFKSDDGQSEIEDAKGGKTQENKTTKSKKETLKSDDGQSEIEQGETGKGEDPTKKQV